MPSTTHNIPESMLEFGQWLHAKSDLEVAGYSPSLVYAPELRFLAHKHNAWRAIYEPETRKIRLEKFNIGSTTITVEPWILRYAHWLDVYCYNRDSDDTLVRVYEARAVYDLVMTLSKYELTRA